MNVRRNQVPLALLFVGVIAAGCNDGTSGAIGPVDIAELRPNGSRQVKVGFIDGTPSTGGSARPAMPTPPHDPGMMAQPPPPPMDSDLGWLAPTSWTRTEPSSQMRLAQYTIPRVKGDATDGELAVFHLGTGGGSVDETFNRWQGSFDADAVKGATRTERTAGAMAVHVLEVSGKYKPDAAMMAGDGGAPVLDKPGMRMIGAIVMSPTGPYYFKMIGPDKTVVAARDDLYKLLDSCKLSP